MKAFGKETLNIVVDGFPIENLWSIDLEMGTYESDWDFESGAMYRDRPSNVQATLRASNGTQLKFNVVGKEQIGNTVYFYGPLRDLVPDIFKDIDPTEWQVAYLGYIHRPSLDRFKMRRTDPIFETELALTFKSGYEAGVKAGAETERKLARIAEEGLKNPPKSKSKDTKAAYSGILGDAFRRKSGK